MFYNFPNLAVELNHRNQVISQQFKGVMVACSGGLDSTVLLHSLCEFTKAKKTFALAICHTNFGLRGKESELDQLFSRDLANHYNLPFFTRSIASQERDERSGESLQEWARRLRYQDFKQYAADGWLIALGHHQDDLAENVLLRLSRGCSVGGMAGMRVFDPPLWRPLLTTSRTELEAMAKKYGVTHREDETNAKLDYSRNVIRHRVLPELEKLFPGAAKRLAQTASEAATFVEISRASLSDKLRRSKDKPQQIGQWPRELAHEALVGQLDLTPAQRSRELLDDLWQHLRTSAEVQLVRAVSDDKEVVVGGGVLEVRARPLPEAAKQHRHNVQQPCFALHLQPGSYAILSQAGQDLKVTAVGLSPVTVQGYGASGGKSLRFQDRKQSFRWKTLMQTWGVAPEARSRATIVDVGGVTLGIFVEGKLLTPGLNGEAEEVCSPILIEEIHRGTMPC